jgi:hypothetical protein
VIIDTGSGIAAFPCKNYCTNCGSTHINDYYEVDKSSTKYFYQCGLDSGCSCFDCTILNCITNNLFIESNKCKFEQSYGEGS